MLIKCAKGMFLVQRNHRDAFNLDAFIEKYIDECFDKAAYIVGDISSTILRLKAFDLDPKSDSYFGNIDNYIDVSCAFGCPHYVLKRIKNEEEYKHLEKTMKNAVPQKGKIEINPIVKENFDKESLVLKSTPKVKPNIILDSKKINAIPKGELPKDIKDYIIQQDNQPQQVKQEAEVETQTYVSASPDFDPTKKENYRKNKNKNSNLNNGNNNRNNQIKKNKNKKPNDNKR
ncbi:MAG: YutD-like domain-containing protein [Anaeroplasma sp.]